MAGGDGDGRWTDARLDRMRGIGDPVADEPVRAVLDRGGVDEVNAIMQTLVRVDQPVPADLPGELGAYLTGTLPMPAWADMVKIERGQRLFETWGLDIATCLFCWSLPSSYAAANGVKVLYLTAQLDTNTRRRVMETGQFLMDVLTVGGLGEGGAGRRTVQRVRLMHAAVRHLIEARRSVQPQMWADRWGIPINQEDLAGTMLAFALVVDHPLAKLGVRVSDEDIEAYIHLWNVIAHLLGLCDDMRVRDLSDATALAETIKRRQFRASPEGQELTRALLDLLRELTPGHSFDAMVPPLVRYLVGEQTAELLDVPNSNVIDLERLGGLARMLSTFVLGDPVRDAARYRLVSDIVRPFGRELLTGVFRMERGRGTATFSIPDHLARSWELSP